MFTYPLLPGLLHLDPHAFGLWTGASVHEIAQVVAAAFQDGKSAGEFGTIAKLSRVMLLAPVVIALGWMAARSAAPRTIRRPMRFLAAADALVRARLPGRRRPQQSGHHSVSRTRRWIATVTTFLLSVALAAMGLETDIRKLTAKGIAACASRHARFPLHRKLQLRPRSSSLDKADDSRTASYFRCRCGTTACDTGRQRIEPHAIGNERRDRSARSALWHQAVRPHRPRHRAYPDRPRFPRSKPAPCSRAPRHATQVLNDLAGSETRLT